MKELERNVIQWAKDKGIFEKATRSTQCDKTIEEVIELKEATTKLDLLDDLFLDDSVEYYTLDHKIENNANKEMKDAIGDVLVTLIIQAEMNGTSLDECLELAWDEIKDRTGKMIEGTFVKDK